MMSRDNKGLSPSEDSYVKATEYLHMLVSPNTKQTLHGNFLHW